MPEDTAPALAIDGGAPLRTSVWPAQAVPAPADDIAPLATLESEFAARLGLIASAVIAYRDQAAAFDAAFASLEPLGRDEVVVPALLGERLTAAARRAGWRVVPGDVEADAVALATRGLSRALSSATGAIGIAHAFGHPPVMVEIARVAADSGAPIIEDATDGLGASYRGEAMGRTGRAVFAMGAGHVLTAGAAGPDSGGALLVLRDPALAEAARAARDAAGGALPEEAARIALAELRGADAEIEARQRLAWDLTFGLSRARALASMPHSRYIHHAYDRYVVRLRGLLWKRPMEDTLAAIRAEGVPCEAAVGPSLHLDPEVVASMAGDNRVAAEHFAAASRLPGELIAIPLHGGLTSKDMDEVNAVLRKVEQWSQ